MPDNEKFDPRDQFGFRLGRLARFWRARLDEKMRPHGLTQARWVVMVHLRRGGNGFKQKDLADFVGIEGPTLVHILDNLEKQGFIERRQDKSDRRGKTVHLTEEGWRILELLDEVVAEVRRENLAGISVSDLAHCLTVFENIESHVFEGTNDQSRSTKIRIRTERSD